MRWKIYLTLFIAGGLISLLVTKCGRDTEPSTVFSPTTLESNEKEKIVINLDKGRVSTTRNRNKKTPAGGRTGTGPNPVSLERRDYSGVREAVVVVTNSGDVVLYTKHKGWVSNPGLCLLVSDELRAGLDLELAYYREYSFLVGGSFNRQKHFRGHMAVAYQAPFKRFNNTQIFLSLDNNSDLGLGLRLSF